MAKTPSAARLALDALKASGDYDRLTFEKPPAPKTPRLFSHELTHGAHYFKVNGITRLIWFQWRAGYRRQFACKDGILVLGGFGFCLVLAPFRRR